MAEHVRIDDGVARGKKQRRSTPLRRSPDGVVESIPAGLDPETVLKRYLTAPTSSTIARELGVKRSSLTKWLRDTVPEQWKAVQVVRADMMKEDGTEGLYGARNALDLARAREVLKAAQWDLERLDSANYGQKQEVTHNLTGLSDALAAISQARLVAVDNSKQVIDVTPEKHASPTVEGVGVSEKTLLAGGVAVTAPNTSTPESS